MVDGHVWCGGGVVCHICCQEVLQGHEGAGVVERKGCVLVPEFMLEGVEVGLVLGCCFGQAFVGELPGPYGLAQVSAACHNLVLGGCFGQ